MIPVAILIPITILVAATALPGILVVVLSVVCAVGALFSSVRVVSILVIAIVLPRLVISLSALLRLPLRPAVLGTTTLTTITLSARVRSHYKAAHLIRIFHTN